MRVSRYQSLSNNIPEKELANIHPHKKWLVRTLELDKKPKVDEVKTVEIIQSLLKDKFPKPGSVKNRENTAPEKGKTTLLEAKNA